MSVQRNTPIFDSGWSPLNRMQGDDHMAVDLGSKVPRWLTLAIIAASGIAFIIIGDWIEPIVGFWKWMPLTLEGIGIAILRTYTPLQAERYFSNRFRISTAEERPCSRRVRRASMRNTAAFWASTRGAMSSPGSS
jgi:hypothetical protein